MLERGATRVGTELRSPVAHDPAAISAAQIVHDLQQPSLDECPSSPSFCCCSSDGDALARPAHHASPKPCLAAQHCASSLKCKTIAAAASTRLTLATRHADDLPAGSGACPVPCVPATGAARAPSAAGGAAA